VTVRVAGFGGEIMYTKLNFKPIKKLGGII
jgi:hypothetical protein